MQNHGILREIRDLLALGNTSRKVIDMGYAPGSVYKAQRQVRDGRVQGVQSPSKLTLKKGVPGEPLFLRGNLSVYPDGEEGPILVSTRDVLAGYCRRDRCLIPRMLGMKK